MNYSDALIRKILTETRTVALIGASPKPNRPSNGVMRFLLEKGYDVTPVNPACAGTKIHDRLVAATVADLNFVPDMADIFRRSAVAGEAVDEAIAAGIRTIWMQLDVIDHDACKRAEQAGATVIMDRCPVIEYRRLGMSQ